MSGGSRVVRPSARAVAVLLGALVAGPASGQVQGYPVDRPAAGPVPGAPVWSAGAGAGGPVQGYPVFRPEPAPPVGPLPADHLPPEGPRLGPAPAPGWGPGPAGGDDRFRRATPGGRVVEGFPRSLLWEPPLASLREPRLLFMPTTLTNDTTGPTLDTAVGTTVGLLRVGSCDGARQVQLDAFGLVLSRVSNYDYLVESHYRAGLPVTFAVGPWHGKVGYEHTSTHLGDETLVRTGRQPIDYTRDELAVGLGRRFLDDSLRVYGQAAWAFYLDVPGNPTPFRFDLGCEWYRRRVTGFLGQPFAAGNVEFNGANGYSPNLSVQAGWQWRDPGRRLAQTRVFAQYYAGHSVYGQFFRDREDWVGVGLAVDY